MVGIQPHERGKRSKILSLHCHALNGEGRELHELKELVGQMSKSMAVQLFINTLRLCQFKITASN